MFLTGALPSPLPAEDARRLAEVETATLGHFLESGFMVPEIRALFPGERVCGAALTVSLPGDDGTALSHALSLARPGDLLVVDRCGDRRHACWGAVLTAAAQAAGVVGAVIDGYVTDRAAIAGAGFPVWCRGSSPVTTKLRGASGAVSVPVACGGVVVRPGDVVLADENGVCVLAPGDVAAATQRALAMQAAEPGVIERLRRGERLGDINGASARFEARAGSGSPIPPPPGSGPP